MGMTREAVRQAVEQVRRRAEGRLTHREALNLVLKARATNQRLQR
jgi:hypothetical protein